MSTPRFLADEDLRYPIVAAVRRLEPGIDFLRVVDAGMTGKPDPEILDFATAEQRLLVSDVTTMKAIAEQRIAAGVGISGLFLVPKANPTTSVVESLLMIWSASEVEEWANRIVFLPL